MEGTGHMEEATEAELRRRGNERGGYYVCVDVCVCMKTVSVSVYICALLAKKQRIESKRRGELRVVYVSLFVFFSFICFVTHTYTLTAMSSI